jgi:hypothetical protein
MEKLELAANKVINILKDKLSDINLDKKSKTSIKETIQGIQTELKSDVKTD